MGDSSSISTTTKHRVAFWSLGLLLTAAIALNIVALSSSNWVNEDTNITSELPVAVFRGVPNGSGINGGFSNEELNPTSPNGFATYQGMRAGAFRFCFTLADVSGVAPLIKETCTTYRANTDYSYVERDSGSTAFVSGTYLQLCNPYRMSTKIFRQIGIPSSLVPSFLDSFCGFEGYLGIIFQIGAIVAASGAWVAWLASAGATPTKYENRKLTALATCVAALLSLATYILWAGAFTPSAGPVGISLGASAHCTISAAVLLFAASLVARFGPRGEPPVEELPAPTTEPLV